MSWKGEMPTEILNNYCVRTILSCGMEGVGLQFKDDEFGIQDIGRTVAKVLNPKNVLNVEELPVNKSKTN